MSRLRLYISTVAHLKPSQIAYRIWRRLGGKTPLRPGYVSKLSSLKASISSIPVLPELDFDPIFLARFDVDAILDDRIELLHHEEHVDWRDSWHEEVSTPLWRFNLHYHEFLLPLAKAFLDTNESRYLEKAKNIISSWIDACPREKGGIAWDPYVISMRAINWLAFFGELARELSDDVAFVARANTSLVAQCTHLSQHLEKDLLANHYLENLKALVILSCYFNDEETLKIALPLLQGQVDEQVLPDGMHFELSPMYHKVVLEDLLRVTAFLKARGYDERGLSERFRLQDMCNVLYSMERNIRRTPLFNDSGDNVAKSRDALLTCARKRLRIVPQYKDTLPDAGYCFLEGICGDRHVKVIFDTGIPSPGFASGHMHCDALSFELFVDGEPWIVNSGTYAYQDENRLLLKRTAAHSAPQVEDVEQSECWAPFRIARMSSQSFVLSEGETIIAEIEDFKGNRIRRLIRIGRDAVYVEDSASEGKRLCSHFHCVHGDLGDWCGKFGQGCYCPDFGQRFPSVHLYSLGRQLMVMLDPRELTLSCAQKEGRSE